jgi:hypothetical protein
MAQSPHARRVRGAATVISLFVDHGRVRTVAQPSAIVDIKIAITISSHAFGDMARFGS